MITPGEQYYLNPILIWLDLTWGSYLQGAVLLIGFSYCNYVYLLNFGCNINNTCKIKGLSSTDFFRNCNCVNVQIVYENVVFEGWAAWIRIKIWVGQQSSSWLLVGETTIKLAAMSAAHQIGWLTLATSYWSQFVLIKRFILP